MAGKQKKIPNTCQESCSLYSHSIATILLYVFVQERRKGAVFVMLNDVKMPKKVSF